MGRRFGGWLVILCVLGPQLGCRGLISNGPLTPTASLADPTRKAAELPAKEAAQVCLTLAQSMEEKSYEAEAIVQYEKARKHDPRLDGAAMSRRLAILHDSQGNYDKAIEEFEKVRKAAPKDPDLLSDLGYCHYNHGEFAKAEKAFREALTINPKHARAWINLGMTLGLQGRNQECLDSFTNVVSPAHAHSNLAFLLTARSQRDDAKREYRRALSLDPDLRIARDGLARLEASERASSAREAGAAKEGWNAATIDFAPPSTTGPVRVPEPHSGG